MKKYLITFFTISLFVIGSVFFTNYFFDPFFLKNSPALFPYRYMKDERQNKTNLIINDTPQFDALLIGSSRTSYMWQKSFKNNTVFNYSSSSLYPIEYLDFIKFSHSKRPLKKIYLGLDFFGTEKTKNKQAKLFKSYLQIAQKGLLQNFDRTGLDVIRKNYFCLHQPSKGYYSYYTNNLDKMFVRPSEKDFNAQCLYLLKQYKATIYNQQTYIFNPKLDHIFKDIKTFCESENIELIPFTTPSSESLFSLLNAQNMLPYYEKWLTLCVQNFGQIFDFMGLTIITKNKKNYADTHHFSPSVGHKLAAIFEGRLKLTKDLGALVTKDNLEKHLQDIRIQAAHADKDPIKTFEKLVSKTK